MRRVLSLLLGTATVVGFESTFGLAKAPVLEFPLPRWRTGDDTLDDILMCRPGGIIRVRSPHAIQFDGKRVLVAA